MLYSNLSSLLPVWVVVTSMAMLMLTEQYHPGTLLMEVFFCIAAEMMLLAWHSLVFHQL